MRHDFDQTLKIGSRDYLLLMPFVMMTIVRAAFVLATFVYIREISAVTYQILTKLFTHILPLIMCKSPHCTLVPPSSPMPESIRVTL